MNARLLILPFFTLTTFLNAEAPKSPDQRIVVELIAEAPDIVTPTGLGVDAKGRVLVIESHTHFRPKDYEGPERDRVLMFTIDASGKTKRTIFYEGLLMGMDVAVGADGWVYLAERSRILRVRDADGDGKAEKAEDVIVMKTTGNYPHNGLSGLSFDARGNLVFGLGENLGHAYTMMGRDGVKIEGSAGIGGGLFRCTAKGEGLRQIARGFWNPFGTCVDKWGRIFAVDNDPGSSPPCRLLHVVEGGDYGYRYKYGRTGIHPFLAWDGELRGTLPMIHGTGEAPCEVIHFDSPTFPQEYRGRLLVTSWGDHRLELYNLKRKGTSVTANMTPLVQGGDSFRPVGLAMAPDGSLFLGDWGSSSYNLNKKGRLWRIRPKQDFKAKPLAEPPHIARDRERLKQLQGSRDRVLLIEAASAGTDPFVRHAALMGLAKIVQPDRAIEAALNPKADPREQVSLMLALKQRAPRLKVAGVFLAGAYHEKLNAALALEAARWIADAKIQEHRPLIETFLKNPKTGYPLFRAYLACLDELDDRANPDRFNEKFALPQLADPNTTDTMRANLLRYMPGKHKALDTQKLLRWLGTGNPALQHEAIWKIRMHLDESTHLALRKLVLNKKAGPGLRLAAVAAIGSSASPDTGTLLEVLALNEPAMRDETLRSLVGAHFEIGGDRHVSGFKTPEANRVLGKPFAKDRPEPADSAAWLQRLDALPGKADLAAGERIFHNQKIAQCSKCHQVSERGTRVGPDLTYISRGMDRRRLLESILQPSKEVAPYMRAWSITMNDGTEHTGIALRRGGNSEVYLGLAGQEIRLDKRQIKTKQEGQKSMMPEGLALTLTDRELRDLLAFLMTRR